MNKKHFASILLLLCCAVTMQAQTAQEDIKANPYHAGSVYTAYIPTTKELTPSPKGYEPFYLSHYGRHGSRYLIGYDRYKKPLEILQKAHDAGALTPRGEQLLEQFKVINADVDGRQEELTQLGGEQHRDIAKRMYKHFPDIFAGRARVDAKSSVVIRCILSMDNELRTLTGINPYLDISADASHHDMYYISYWDKKLGELKKPKGSVADKALQAYSDSLFKPTRVMNEIFSSESFWKDNVSDPYKLVANDIWDVAQNLQGTELRKKMNLMDLFNEEETYNLWQTNNAYWYITYGPSPLNGGTQIYAQRNLIKNIIQEADSCLALKTLNDGNPWHGCTLRFGHDTVVLPTVCFMNLNGYGAQYADLNDLVKNHWYNYRIFMMASNIQLVFYHNKKGGDILVKALLNEEEATMPDLKPVTGPYYKWKDVKALWEKKLAAYKE